MGRVYMLMGCNGGVSFKAYSWYLEVFMLGDHGIFVWLCAREKGSIMNGVEGWYDIVKGGMRGKKPGK